MRVLRQQVNALMSQNAALVAQLVSQQNIAQGLADLLRAITTCLLTRKAWEGRPCSHAKKNFSVRLQLSHKT